MWAYIGTLLVLLGAKQLGDRKTRGWLWFMLGDLLWISEGVKIYGDSANPSVIICETLFLILHIRGFIQWRYRHGNKTINS